MNVSSRGQSEKRKGNQRKIRKQKKKKKIEKMSEPNRTEPRNQSSASRMIDGLIDRIRYIRTQLLRSCSCSKKLCVATTLHYTRREKEKKQPRKWEKMKEEREKKKRGCIESSFPYFLSPFTGLQAQSDLYIGDPTIINPFCHIEIRLLFFFLATSFIHYSLQMYILSMYLDIMCIDRALVHILPSYNYVILKNCSQSTRI